jgi:hypothetical protein
MRKLYVHLSICQLQENLHFFGNQTFKRAQGYDTVDIDHIIKYTNIVEHPGSTSFVIPKKLVGGKGSRYRISWRDFAV